VAVLYAGRVVEAGPTRGVLAKPHHPYTRGLLAALPRIGGDVRKRLVSIPGELPDLVDPDPGCNFRARCTFVSAGCEKRQPLRAPQGRLLRCHRAEAIIDKPLSTFDVHERSEATRGEKILLTGEHLSRSFLPSSWHSDLPFLQKFLNISSASVVRAVDDVSLQVRSGEVLGLVGESGSGKSTLGLLLLRLLGADTGELSFGGAPVPPHPGSQFRKRAQIIFQNPDTSLNPRQSVDTILRRPLQQFGMARGAAVGLEVERLLRMVRLPVTYRERYPHQLSGGEKQRVGIARALATSPDFLVCDEAVSALDVSVQAVILNLLSDLRDELGIAYLFITHDIGVVAHISDNVAVMYRGAVLEEGPVTSLLHPPYHPYTEALLSAVPMVGKRSGEARRVRLVGDPGGAVRSAGCRFASRCPRKLGTICETVPPPRREAGPRHRIACHIPLSDLSSVSLLQQGC
jgi:peptide/nickel transport system ATP-binding protein